MIKEFFMKKLLASQMKNLPKEQQDLILKAVDTNPELFNKIAKEIEEKVKQGKNQMYASLEVMKKYQAELQKVMGAIQSK